MRRTGSVILGLWVALLSVNIAEAVEDSPSSRATLKGIPGVSIGVPKQSGCEIAGLYAQSIGAEVESQLQEAGVKVLKAGQGSVVLRILFACFQIPGLDTVNFFNIVRTDHTIRWPNSNSDAIVTSWSSEMGLGISSNATISKDLRNDIKTRVNQLIGAWLSVNGK